MGQMFRPNVVDPASYRGLAEIFEYCNYDGHDRFRKFNCGQAAACTFLTHHRFYPQETDQAREIMGTIESEHPPDNAGGWAGSSRRRVERICNVHGLDIQEVDGEAELRYHLGNNMPVIVMVQTEGAKILGRFRVPGGHWMVAFAYDDGGVYVTNNDVERIPWPEFRAMWTGLMTRINGMCGVGIVAVPQMADSDALSQSRDVESV